ncbi:hypothetical protein MMC07_003862 [Pseudocyphellaria aurata]|nr:hypothetical protein [Pseudocyphellaria aurata]
MNNSQFRRLLDISTTATTDTATVAPKKDGSVATSLGSRMRSSIPMTPRSVTSSTDFARQVAERNASLNPTTIRKFRSTAAPKGTKLKPGYQDRTQSRISTEEDEKAKRVKALEDMVKLGQVDTATFEAMRDEIVGGDVKDVHLVKGLDWKLLERVRRGEDVLSSTAVTLQSKPITKSPESIPAKDEAGIDEEFEKIEGQKIQPVQKEERVKRGEMAPPPVLLGKKRNRDDILKELKASRLAAAEKEKEKQQPSLGPRFSKFGVQQEKLRIEKDERGREILITMDEDGRTKRKVKKAKIEDENTKTDHVLLMPDKDAKPLGMEVIPLVPRMLKAEDGGDIFEGVGRDYNPLGSLEEDDSDGSDESDESQSELPEAKSLSPATKYDHNVQPQELVLPDEAQTPMPEHIPKRSNNYFHDSNHSEDERLTIGPNPLADSTILAALRRASAIKPLASSNDAVSEEEAAKVARRKKMLEGHDRDEDDMDMSFGVSRFEDGEDGEDRKVKLSVWGREGFDVDGKGGGKGKRKRAPKKRKGDANSAADVLKVMERRKAEAR